MKVLWPFSPPPNPTELLVPPRTDEGPLVPEECFLWEFKTMSALDIFKGLQLFFLLLLLNWLLKCINGLNFL